MHTRASKSPQSPADKARIQTKLEIGRPGDKYEKQADAVADKVMMMPEEEEKVDMMPEEEEKIAMMPEEEEKVSMMPEEEEKVAMMPEEEEKVMKQEDEEEVKMKPEIQSSGNEKAYASSGLANTISSTKGKGQSLPDKTQEDLGSKMGADFSEVTIHTDSAAVQMNQELGAKAFTHGKDIYFNEGNYRPGSDAGKHLLAHELTHTLQQSGQAKQLGKSINKKIQKQDDTKELWIKDKNGNLYYKTKGEAERRKKNLVNEGKWKEYRVTSFESKGKTYWRVETKGLKKATEKEEKPDASGPGQTRVFALTFDDGPHTAALGKGINYTEMVLNTLKSLGIKAGFFIQTGVSYRGANKNGIKLVKRMSKEGHIIGVHTGGKIDHELHTKAAKKGTLESELDTAKSYVKEHTGTTPKYVRPPEGKFNKQVTEVYKKVKLTNLLWDIDGDLGKNLSLGKLKERLLKYITAVKNRGWKGKTPSAPKIVVLYHDIKAGTAKNLKAIIEYIKTLTKKLSGGKDKAAFKAP